MNSSLTLRVWPEPPDTRVHGGASPGSAHPPGKYPLRGLGALLPRLAGPQRRTHQASQALGSGDLLRRSPPLSQSLGTATARAPTSRALLPSPRGAQQKRGASAGSLLPPASSAPPPVLSAPRAPLPPPTPALSPTTALRSARLHVPDSPPSPVLGESSSRAAALPVPGCGEVGGRAGPVPRSPPRRRSSSRGSAEVPGGRRGSCRDDAGSASGDPGSGPGADPLGGEEGGSRDGADPAPSRAQLAAPGAR